MTINDNTMTSHQEIHPLQVFYHTCDLGLSTSYKIFPKAMTIQMTIQWPLTKKSIQLQAILSQTWSRARRQTTRIHNSSSSYSVCHKKNASPFSSYRVSQNMINWICWKLLTEFIKTRYTRFAQPAGALEPGCEEMERECRHDICQFFYTTGVFEANILPQKVRKSRQWQIYDKTA